MLLDFILVVLYLVVSSLCRNGLLPKKLHLEIALGNIFPKEGEYILLPFLIIVIVFSYLYCCAIII